MSPKQSLVDPFNILSTLAFQSSYRTANDFDSEDEYLIPSPRKTDSFKRPNSKRPTFETDFDNESNSAMSISDCENENVPGPSNDDYVFVRPIATTTLQRTPSASNLFDRLNLTNEDQPSPRPEPRPE